MTTLLSGAVPSASAVLVTASFNSMSFASILLAGFPAGGVVVVFWGVITIILGSFAIIVEEVGSSGTIGTVGVV
ncbi:hypothetical protein [Capnocytophaga gingivalis]|uniref:hypothetical protein n=1 Tax=Capnocytophaga gingivalis TaxID=1017 RepID=UPI001E4C9C45|nr:hypothetical protein [Capnocytophaga gingivalis]